MTLGPSEIKRFVELVDGGATPKAYEKELGLARDDVTFHLTLLESYRIFIDTMSEIDRIKALEISSEEKEALLSEAREKFKNAQEVIQHRNG